MRRIIITGVSGVLMFGIALLGFAIADSGSQRPSANIVRVDLNHPAVTLERESGINGTAATNTASGPSKIAAVSSGGVTARALSCTGTSQVTLLAGHDGAASTSGTIGNGSNGIACSQVGRDLAIASGAPPSVVAQFSTPSH